MAKKKKFIEELDVAPGKEEETVIFSNEFPHVFPYNVWKTIFLTMAEQYGGENALMEIQQNVETKEIRAVKKGI